MAEYTEVEARDTDAPAKTKQEHVEKFLTTAKAQFDMVANAESILRDEMEEDLDFIASDQWDDASIKARTEDGKPIITINRLKQFIRQVENGTREANLAIKVAPVDSGSDPATAEVFQGIIKHIETQSDASGAYMTAASHQIGLGRGWVRIVAEYEDDRSFVQQLRLKRIRNPFSVYMDPAAQEIDGSDARFCFVVEDVPVDEFEARYGEEAKATLTEFQSAGNRIETDWMPEGKVRVAEYWYTVPVKEEIVAAIIADQNGLSEAVLTDKEFAELKRRMGKAVKERDRRKVERKQVKMALICANQILAGNDDKTEGADWPGKWIPIVPVYGDELDRNGILDYRGMVRDAKDQARLYNLQVSSLAETMASAPLSQWVGYTGQFEGHEAKWALANRKRFTFLEVNPITAGGQVAPLPQRVSPNPDISSILNSIQQADADLKAAMGLYEPSLGVRSGAQSGKAISALQRQGEMANSNFLDNLSRAIRAVGRILVDLIPHYYDAPRVLRIIGMDEMEKTVMVYAGEANAPQEPPTMEGLEGVYDLSAGRYDVTVQVGPNMGTKRQEAVEMMSQIVQAAPQLFPIIGDLFVSHMDWPGAPAIAKRLKKAVPPEFRDEEPGEVQIPPEVQQQVAQMEQQLQLLGQQIQEAQRIIETKQIETQGKVEAEKARFAAQVEIEKIRADFNQLKLEAEMLKVKAEGQEKAKLAVLEGKIEADEQEREHQHEAAMAAQDRTADHADKIIDATIDQNVRQEQAEREDIRAEREKDENPPKKSGE